VIPTSPERGARRAEGAVSRFRRTAALCLIAATGSTFAAARPSAASRDPGKGLAYYFYSLSQQAQFTRNYNEALRYLEQAVRSDDSPDLRVELADLYSSLNQNDAAEQEVRRALSADPADVEGRRLLAQILVSRSPEGDKKDERLKEAETIYRGLIQDKKEDESVVLALAEIQTDRGDLDGARSTLEGFRASHPVSSSVLLELARNYQQAGRNDDAIALLRTALEKDRDNREALNGLGLALEEAGRFAEAEKAYRRLIELNPNNPYGHYRLSGPLLAQKRYREAQDHLKTALEFDPRNGRALLELGQAYEGTHETAQAQESYRKALELDPASLEPRFFLARLHQNRGEDDAALTQYGEILKATEKRESSAARAFYALASTQVGLIRLLQKKYPVAIQSLGRALAASDKPSEDLYALLGRTYIEAKQISDARNALEAGRAKFPDSPELWAMEGELLLRESRPAPAQEIFKDLLSRSEESEEAYLQAVQACLRAENPRAAEIWVREGVRKHPDSRDLAFQGAVVEERLGRFKESEKRFRELLRKDPENAEALNYLGYMLADRGVKLRDSLAFLEKAVELEPDNFAYLDSLGWAHYRLGRLESAEALLGKAAGSSRNDATVLDHLGDVLAARGKSAEAVSAYRTALQHGPEKPEEIRKKIRKLGSNPDEP
jgi:tetratricopeptide (TPR) repeat protein